jgi:hypothetical protein
MAICEEVTMDEGRVTTLNLGDYKIPTMRDIPLHETTLVAEATCGPGPFNAKPAAEHSITPVPPAIANAVFNATAVRITELPITAEKVLEGLRALRRGGVASPAFDTKPLSQGSLGKMGGKKGDWAWPITTTSGSFSEF